MEIMECDFHRKFVIHTIIRIRLCSFTAIVIKSHSYRKWWNLFLQGSSKEFLRAEPTTEKKLLKIVPCELMTQHPVRLCIFCEVCNLHDLFTPPWSRLRGLACGFFRMPGVGVVGEEGGDTSSFCLSTVTNCSCIMQKYLYQKLIKIFMQQIFMEE